MPSAMTTARASAVCAPFVLALGVKGGGTTTNLPTTLPTATEVIDYNQLGYTGTIPTQFGNLGEVTSLNLGRNSLTGTIPTQLGSMTLVTTAGGEWHGFLASNELTGSLPSELGNLVKLADSFALENNVLTGAVPTELGRLSNMGSHVELDYQAFSSSIPTQLGNLMKMTSELQLNDNSMTGTLPTQLGRMTGLVNSYRFLETNKFTGSIPTEFGKLTAITMGFDLSSNSLSAAIPTELGNLVRLTDTFKLASNQLCDDVPTEVQALSKIADTSWAVTTSNAYIGTLCCEALPAAHTCTPTLVPTTPSPSTLPTISLPPSAAPTPLPSTPSPSPLPTSVPTLLPTVSCDSGTYLDSEGACADCGIGKYSNNSAGPPWATECSLCPAGRYNIYTAQPSCTACSEGKLSSADRTSCGDCPSGNYVYNDESCEECEEGYYAPTAVADACIGCAVGYYTGERSAATSCSACDAGTYSAGLQVNCTSCSPGQMSGSRDESCTNCSVGKYNTAYGSSGCSDCEAGQYQAHAGAVSCEECGEGRYSSSSGASACMACSSGTHAEAASSSCSTCDAGSWSNASASACSDCARGKRSSSGASICSDCERGKFAADEGSATCSECSSGTYQDSLGMANCLNCTVGTVSGSTGSRACESCLAGYFQPSNGQSNCLKCSSEEGLGFGPAYTSVVGSGSCSVCVERHYMDGSGECVACMTGARCAQGSTLHNLVILRGYYRFDVNSPRVYPCTTDDCTGCNASCATDNMCASGSGGPLCGVCDPGYFLRDSTIRCSPCTMANAWAGPVIVVSLLLIVVMITLAFRKRVERWYVRHRTTVIELGGRATALFVTMQIILLLKANRESVGGQPLPDPYTGFLTRLSFFTLDAVQFVPFNCMYEDGFSHFDTLILETLVPIAIFGFSLVANFTYRTFKPPTWSYIKFRQIFSYAIQIVFLVLPTISRRIGQSLQACTVYDAGGETLHYLAADHTISCDASDGNYKAMFVFATVMLFVYPIGVPCTLLVMMSKFRKELNPSAIPDAAMLASEEEVIREREPIFAAEPITTFARIYRPRFWWYEIYNMVRRLALTCMSLAFNSLASTTIFVISVAILTLVVERESRPYINPFLSAFTYCLQWQILLFIVVSLLLDAEMTEGLSGVAISAILMISNVLLIAAVFRNTHSERQISKSVWRQASKRFMFPTNLALEDDDVAAYDGNDVESMSSATLGENPLRVTRANSAEDEAAEAAEGGQMQSAERDISFCGDVELRDVPSFLTKTERATHLTMTPSFTNFSNPLSRAGKGKGDGDSGSGSVMGDARAAAAGELDLDDAEADHASG